MNRLICVLAGAAFIVAPSAAQGPTSEYFIADSESGRISVVHGNSIIRSWTGRDVDAMPIAVADTIRTFAELPKHFGSEYDHLGNWTGVDYPDQGGPLRGRVDGTTDGVTRNFLAAFDDGGIWQYDRDWTNPVRLFFANRPTGVTYDTTTGNLWVIEFGSTRVAEYDIAGNQLSSFGYTTPTTWMGSLAYEPATDTLWATHFSTDDMYQFDKSGNVLQNVQIPGLAGFAWGGEFAISELSCNPCDMDCNEMINAFDIQPFLELLFDPSEPCCGERGDIGSTGDTNGDGEINSFDIEGFLDCLFP